MIYFLFDLDDTLIIHDHGRHLNYEMIQPDYRLNNLLSRIRGESHIYTNELGGYASLGGVYPAVIKNETNGTLDINSIIDELDPYEGSDEDIHLAQTKLIALENTHNSCGGKAIDNNYFRKVKSLASKKEEIDFTICAMLLI